MKKGVKRTEKTHYDYVKKYQQTEKGKTAFRNSAKKYWKTERGKKVREEYLKKNATKVSAYQRAYHEKAREKARQLGVCERCRKYPVAKKSYNLYGERPLTICSYCVKASAEARLKRKMI